MSGTVGIPWYIAWPLVGVSCYGALWFLASRSVYYPLKYPQGFWSLQAQLHAEDVWLHTSDGVQIHAWWVQQEGAALATLYLHGNAGNVTHRYPQIHDHGCRVVNSDARLSRLWTEWRMGNRKGLVY